MKNKFQFYAKFSLTLTIQYILLKISAFLSIYYTPFTLHFLFDKESDIHYNCINGYGCMPRRQFPPSPYKVSPQF